MSKTRILCHLVFATKKRITTIPLSKKDLLYAYIRHTAENNGKTKIIVMNGTSNHIHLLIDLHPSEALAGFVKLIKQSTANWMSQNPHFPKFTLWCKGYFAASVSPTNIDRCINYISNQEEHHKVGGFDEELKFMIDSSSLIWHPDDLQ